MSLVRVVRVTRSPVTVDAAVTLEEGPRSCSATMHEAFRRLSENIGTTDAQAKTARSGFTTPPVEVHVVKLRRRRP